MKTHCSNGHALTADNVRFAGSKKNPRCRICERKRMRDYQTKRRKEEPEKVSALRQDSHARMRYGLRNLTHREEILATQSNACAICRTKNCIWGQGFNNRWHIDHDHNNPEPNHRGILCGRCNLMLGRIEEVGMEKIVSYMEAYK